MRLYAPGCRSFDDAVGAPQERLREREADGFRRLGVDDELELRGLLDGQIGGLGALEELVDVAGQALGGSSKLAEKAIRPPASMKRPEAYALGRRCFSANVAMR